MNLTTRNRFQNHVESLTSIMDAIPIPVCLFDPSGKLEASNHLGERLFKKNMSQEFFRKHLKQIYKQSKILLSHNIRIHEKEFFLTAAPVYNGEKIAAIIALFEDAQIYKTFFERKLETYKTTISDLQTIFDNSYDVLYVTDGKGMTIRVSSACEVLWGKKPEELIGHSVFELEREGIFTPSATRIALEQGKKIEVIQQTKTGRRLMVVSTPIRNVDGKIIRVVNASRDITEIQELEEEINRMRMMIEGYQRQLSDAQQSLKNNNHQLIYRSKAMSEVISMLFKIAVVDSTVLITGESGVGKEVIANEIHQLSFRNQHPFIKINCAAIPESLLESELFGYEQGAFTGAKKHGKAGLFELANEGTLFLDEIGDMPLSLQAKLLRVLQEGEIMRIGGQKPIKINVRIIAATNQDLPTKIAKKEFREDLYYRLNVIPIDIPPLRKRREDIIPLIQYFLKIFSETFHVTKNFSKSVTDLLEKYDWPGNVRELKNVVERMVVTSDSKEIGTDNIPKYILESIEAPNHPSRPKSGIEIHEIMPLKQAVAQVESQLINMVAQESTNLYEIAQRLGVNQSTISRKMQKYGLSQRSS